MLLLSTSSLRGYGLHRIFRFASQAAYDGIGLDLSYDDFDTTNAEYLQDLVKTFSLPIRSITAYERRMSRELVDSVMELASFLGVTIVNFYPPNIFDKNNEWFLEYLPIVCAKYPSFQIGIVNVEPKTFLLVIPEYRNATLVAIKKITGKTSLSIKNIDTESGIDLLKTFSILGNSIINIYLADKALGKDCVYFGKGDMPLESFFIKLKNAGYDGIFTLRTLPKELDAGGTDEQVYERLQEIKEFVEQYFGAVGIIH